MLRYFSKSRLIFVSPLLLATATGLLVLIIVTFALSNYDREKKQMTKGMLQKASTLMRVVKSGARSSYVADIKHDVWNTNPWFVYAQRVIDHVAEDPDIAFIAIVNEKGEVFAHNEKPVLKPDFPGKRVELQYRILSSSPYGRVFEAVHPYIPYRSAMHSMFSGGWMGKRHNLFMYEKRKGKENKRNQLEGKGPPDVPYFVLIGLDMTEYDSALGRHKYQIFIISLAMLLVGVGGWLSLAALQGYKVSQQTLSEIQAFTAHLIKELPVGIIATDKDGYITTWNKVAASLTGLTHKKTLGKKPQSVLASELATFFSDKVNNEQVNSIENGFKKEIKMTIENREQVFNCHRINIREGGDFQGQVLMVSNLTDLKTLEKNMREHERLAAVGRMAAGVAHEVRNPLSSIKGLALLLKNKFIPGSKENETTGLLIQEVERMNRTISELLSFARPPSLDLQKVDLPDFLQEEIELISPDASNCGVETLLELDETLPPVLADRDRLKQVFINILLNGVQAIKDGGTLKLSAKNNPADKTVRIEVIDSGCGIDEENLGQIFFPYFTTKKGGTGIGLAISQKIISDHGGTIRVESQKDKGATFIIELPIVEDS